jgi:hypothetical protein
MFKVYRLINKEWICNLKNSFSGMSFPVLLLTGLSGAIGFSHFPISYFLFSDYQSTNNLFQILSRITAFILY